MYATGPLGTIILVDDDSNITELLKFNLGSEGFGIAVVPQAKDVPLSEVANARMVICDALDQPYTGFDLLDDIKADPTTCRVPVIICSASEGEDTIIEAFDLGADDFITKPFSLRELLARVKAVLRRHPRRTSPEAPRPVHSDLSVPSLNLRIDTITQRVIEDGSVVPLTKPEYAILVFLIKNQNSFFSRNDICLEVWKDEASANVRIVDTNISRLRKKLGESGKYIVNRYGMGYAFVDKLS